jgi:hypothetical protein
MKCKRNRTKFIVLVACIAFVLAAGFFVYPLTVVQREYFLNRGGNAAEISYSESATRADGSSLATVQIHSDRDLNVRLRLLLPAAVAGKKLPLLLLVGGHRTGRNAVELIDRPDGIAYAAIDYPYSGHHKLSGALQIAGAIPKIQTALLDTPPALMLAMDWLSQQEWFDADRAELVGVSLGVPFGAVTGALDSRFSKVWLIHGASDNFEWLMSAAQDRVQNPFLRRMAAGSALFLAHGNSFNTKDWVRQIAPRPVVVVLARNDDRVPVQSADDFIADFAHVTFIWTEGQHIGPDRTGELHQIIRIVKENIKRSPDPV